MRQHSIQRTSSNFPFLKLELEGSKWGWRSKKEPHHVSHVFIWNAFHSEWELSAEGLEDLNIWRASRSLKISPILGNWGSWKIHGSRFQNKTILIKESDLERSVFYSWLYSLWLKLLSVNCQWSFSWRGNELRRYFKSKINSLWKQNEMPLNWRTTSIPF